MATQVTLKVNIVTPHIGDIVGKNTTISVTGNVALQGNPGDALKKLNGVDVQFGENGSKVKATVNGFGWKCDGAIPSGVHGGAPLQISASALATYHPNGNPAGEDESVDGDGTVVVLIEQSPPVLTVEHFDQEVI